MRESYSAVVRVVSPPPMGIGVMRGLASEALGVDGGLIPNIKQTRPRDALTLCSLSFSPQSGWECMHADPRKQSNKPQYTQKSKSEFNKVCNLHHRDTHGLYSIVIIIVQTHKAYVYTSTPP